MGLRDGRLGKALRRGSRGGDRSATRPRSGMDPADEQHLAEFVSTRRSVEGFVEPRTAVSDVTLLLVAHDGEWTRRRVPSVSWAHHFANSRGIASYDAAVVGYPQRMRDFNQRRKASGQSDS